MPETIKKKLVMKSENSTAAVDGDDMLEQAAPAQAAGAPIPPPPMAAGPSGVNYRIPVIIAAVALVLFGVLIVVQLIELGFYAKPGMM